MEVGSAVGGRGGVLVERGGLEVVRGLSAIGSYLANVIGLTIPIQTMHSFLPTVSVTWWSQVRVL